MDLLEAIKARRSIREYSDKPIPKNILEKIIDAARSAPTARNLQPWEFVVATDKELIKKIAGITDHGKFLSQAAACILVLCSDTKYYLEDGCAATQNILLAASSLGIGSCWVAGDKKPYCSQLNDLLFVPLNFKLVSIVGLGYPKCESPLGGTDKRPLKELLHWQKF
jgi:nitroreductase